MLRLLLFVLLPLLLLLGPSLWVQWVLRRHAQEDPALPATGGELAADLLHAFRLHDVRIEETRLGDHYDPETRTVCLAPAIFRGRSLTAIATAAHEVGHALQHATHYQPLLTRSALAKRALRLQRLSAWLFVLSPLLLLASRSPAPALLLVTVALLSTMLTTLIHVITLPVEFDASFRRALPILADLHRMGPDDLRTVRRILFACALTYVSESVIALVTLRFWLRLLAR